MLIFAILISKNSYNSKKCCSNLRIGANFSNFGKFFKSIRKSANFFDFFILDLNSHMLTTTTREEKGSITTGWDTRVDTTWREHLFTSDYQTFAVY